MTEEEKSVSSEDSTHEYTSTSCFPFAHRKININQQNDHNKIHYKKTYIPSMISPYYFCCCNFLPKRMLDYDKVVLNEDYFDISGANGPVLSNEFNRHIIRSVLLPYYDTRLKYIANTQICWSRAGNVAYTTSSILVGMASVLSFASGTYPSIHLNFLAGSLGLLALICKEFASYSNTLDHSKIQSLNKLLKQLNIQHELSDTSEDVSSLFSSSPASFVATNHQV